MIVTPEYGWPIITYNILFTVSDDPEVNNIESTAEAKGIKVYPNPTYGILTIESDNIGQHSIEITSLNGQIIHRSNFTGSSHQIDLSSFQEGVYFIKVRSRDYVRTEKLIKL